MPADRKLDNYPDYLPIGTAVRLVSLRAFARELGTEARYVSRMLGRIGVPVFRVEGTHAVYFNQVSLDLALYCLLRPAPFGKAFKGHSEPAILSEILDDDNAPIAREWRWIGEHYGTMDRRALKSRLIGLAPAFRTCGSKLLKRRVGALRKLFAKHKIALDWHDRAREATSGRPTSTAAGAGEPPDAER